MQRETMADVLKGANLEALARVCEKSRRTIDLWRVGFARPGYQSLVAMAAHLKTDVRRLAAANLESWLRYQGLK